MRIGLLRSLSFVLFAEAIGGEPTGAGAPPAPTPPAAGAAPTPPATPPAPEKDPNWLNERLGKAKKSGESDVLKQLGVPDIETAKKAIADLKAKEDAEKSAAQKAAELAKSLETTTAEKQQMAEALGSYAKTAMAALTEAQRQAVTNLAGEDPAKQLKTIEALSPTWTASSTTTTNTAPGTPPAAGTGAPPPQKITDTAPAPHAPKDGPGISPTDHKAVYLEMKKTNPVVAARYAEAHGVHDS